MMVLTADILRLENFNIGSLFIGFFVLIGAFNCGAKLIGDASRIIGKPVKWIQKKEEETKRIEAIVKAQAELEKQFLDNAANSKAEMSCLEGQFNSIGTELNELKNIVIDDRIDRMRYEILDMASAISESKRWYSVEQFKHALKTYSTYEQFLKEHNKKNGEIEISYEVIKNAYREKYKGMKDEEDGEEI